MASCLRRAPGAVVCPSLIAPPTRCASPSLCDRGVGIKAIGDLMGADLSTYDCGAAGLNAFVFKNRAGHQLTRFGVRYLLRKYLPDYLSPSRRRKIHPHSLRHIKAIHLLNIR